jgi:hypothetical protein
MDNPQEERAITHHAGPVRIGKPKRDKTNPNPEQNQYNSFNYQSYHFTNTIVIDGRFGVVVGNLTYYVRGRGFDSRTVQTFVCMNMSVCIGSGCFYV